MPGMRRREFITLLGGAVRGGRSLVSHRRRAKSGVSASCASERHLPRLSTAFAEVCVRSD